MASLINKFNFNKEIFETYLTISQIKNTDKSLNKLEIKKYQEYIKQ